MYRTILNNCLVFILFFIATSSITAQALTKLTGTISDQVTHEALPYCSISVTGSNLGTISNELGYFEILVPDSLMNQNLNFSFLGYYAYETPAKELALKSAKISLNPASSLIQEVIIRPLSPEEILKKAIQRRTQNYYSAAFVTEGFYREMLTENNQYIEFIEAFVKGYSYAQSDTAKPEIQLIQGRTRNDLKKLQFMHKESEKKQRKAENKAVRKGNPLSEEEKEAIQINFANPKLVLMTDPVKNGASYLDSNQFRKFNYTFEKDNRIGSHDLLVISFESKKVIDHQLLKGTLYLDKQSLAFVSIAMHSKIVIPAFAKPILFTLGISIDHPEYSTENEYTEVDGKWFLRKVLFEGNGSMEKRRIGKENDFAELHAEQAFVSTNAYFTNIQPIPKEKQITDKPLKKQLGEYDEAFWAAHNKIEFGKNR